MGTVVSGFGSALNIETLVAAAERRETPVEVFGYSFLILFWSLFIRDPYPFFVFLSSVILTYGFLLNDL